MDSFPSRLHTELSAAASRNSRISRHNFLCLVVRRAAQQTPRVARADHLRLHKETSDV